MTLSVLGTAGPSAQVTERPSLNVLFIGNSYVYFNNLGDIVAGIAAADPMSPIINPTLAVQGGATLAWHLENGPALQALENGRWDYVVLQEQSLLGGRTVDGKIVMGDRAQFSASVRDWVQRIRSRNAQPVLFMTWAWRQAGAAEMHQQLADAYLNAGRELDVRVAPVGLAWAETRRRLRTLDLHIWDNSHPTPAGSYLAASVIYSTVTGRSPLGAPSVVQGRPTVDTAERTIIDESLRVPLVDLREATATELQEIAWEVVNETAESGLRGQTSAR